MFLSIDIGGSYIKYAVLTENFTIVKKWKKPTKIFTAAAAFYDYLCENIDTEHIKSAGVSAPGIIDDDATVLSKAARSVSIMYRTNIKYEVEKRLKLSAAVINDARAAGLCEVTLGNAQNSKSSIYWIIGTGIGGAIFSKDQVVKGIDNLAGEFSHLPIKVIDGKTRGISSLTAIPALLRIYQSYSHENVLATSEEICQKYLLGEPMAVQAIEEWCQNIVLGLHLVTMFYNPEIICIGGGISEEDWFIEKIQRMFYFEIRHTFSDLVTTKVNRCKYNNDANLIGAAVHAARLI